MADDPTQSLSRIAVVSTCVLDPSSTSTGLCVRAWDPHSAQSLAGFKKGSCVPHGLCISENFLLAAQGGKSGIHVWRWNQEALVLYIPAPEKLTSLAVSPDGFFCYGGASSGKIYVWELSSGRLLNVIGSAHYRPVSVIKITDDGCYCISGGDDATIQVWDTLALYSSPLEPSPAHTWSEHTLPITDIHVGLGGTMARVFTASQDRTCKIWELCTGVMLQSIVFPSAVQSLVVDPLESHMYSGGSDSIIYKTMLHTDQIREGLGEQRVNSGTQVFAGHKGRINSLAVTEDGMYLVSGCQDGSVNVWDSVSLQCIRMQPYSSPVTNVAIVSRSLITDQPDREVAPIAILKKRIDHIQDNVNQAVPVMLPSVFRHEVSTPVNFECTHTQATDSTSDMGVDPDQIARLEKENEEWKAVARELYNQAANTLLSDLTPS